MVKHSTLTALLLVLWLTMLVGTQARAHKNEDDESWTEWASKGLGLKQNNAAGGKHRPSEEQLLGEWLHVLQRADVALEADNQYQATTMVAGVVAQFSQDESFPNDKEKMAKFQEALKAVQQAVESDNKAKATVLMKGLVSQLKKQVTQLQGGGGDQPKRRGVKYLEREQDLYIKREMLGNYLALAFIAIAEEQKGKAEEMIKGAAEIIKNDKTLCREEKVAAFLTYIQQVDKFLTEGEKEKAEGALQGAALAVGINHLRQQEVKEQAAIDKLAQKRENLESFLEGAFEAIKQDQTEKAEEMINAAAEILKRDKNLSKEQKGIAFLQFLEEADKYLKADSRELAEGAIQAAALAVGIDHLQEQHLEAKAGKKDGASGSEL